MKLIYLSLIFIFFISEASAQKKKDIKKHNIKSVTEIVTSEGEEGSKTRKDQYTVYSKDGKLLIKEDYKKDGSLKRKETHVYDSYDNKIEETLFDAKDKKNIKKVCKYNALKDKTEELEYKNNELVSKTIFSHNADGNVVSENVYDASGTLKKKITYTYNNKKPKETKVTTDPDGTVKSVKKYTYEFY